MVRVEDAAAKTALKRRGRPEWVAEALNSAPGAPRADGSQQLPSERLAEERRREADRREVEARAEQEAALHIENSPRCAAHRMDSSRVILNGDA